MAILTVVLFLMFQAVFSWAKWPMDQIQALMDGTGQLVARHMDDGMLRSLLVDGIIAGAGSVLVFLPQILILFLFILALEDSGYLPRAAFLLDRVMAGVGLTGRSFIPLLSSFACAIPGIMATRTIADPRDRLSTILIAPLMTCSARLPVYALLIGAFIPARTLALGVNLQGLVLFVLYMAGIVSAMGVAWVLQRLGRRSGPAHHTLMMELPAYRWPNARNLAIGLWERARIFITRVGTIILSLMIVLWFLSTFPGPPAGATGPADRVQPGRPPGPPAAIRLRADRLQLADLHRAGAGPGRARSGGRRAGHRLRAVGLGRRGRRAAVAADPAHLVAAHRLRAAGLVRVRAAVRGHAVGHPARDRRLAPAHHHGELPVRAGLRRRRPHVLRRALFLRSLTRCRRSSPS